MGALISLWLSPGQSDELSRVFGTIFGVTACIGAVYAYHLDDRLQQMSSLIYAGAAMGVVFATDYYNLFVFWELMAVSSTMLVWANRTQESADAGMRYLLVHIFGGGLLFAGILLSINQTGSSTIVALPPSGSLAAILMLLGVGLNTAIPPLNAWLPDAYSKATVTGAIFMSAFTTKSAVYVLMRIFPGWEILIWFGLAMALYGAVYALLSNDIRKILAYSIISQVGYMVTAVGIGTEMALNGAAAHAFSHILYKSLLLMGAGAVIYATGKSKLSELGGLAGRMKAVLALYMVGAFSIAGVPLFNGFISKSMIVSAASAEHLEIAVLLLMLASIGSLLHSALRIPAFTFFGEAKSSLVVTPLPRNMLLAMGLGAALCTLFGVAPGLLYRLLPYPVDYHPYTIHHLVEMIQIVTLGFLGFWLLRKHLQGRDRIVLDTDWLYRRFGLSLGRSFVRVVAGFFASAERALLATTAGVIRLFQGPARLRKDRTPDMFQILGSVLALFVMLGMFLIFRA
jgi:multicomponent Na+:H+ antiporter subunit D